MCLLSLGLLRPCHAMESTPIDSVLTISNKAVEGGPIRATIPTQRRVDRGTGCGMATRGTRGMARAVGAAGPPPGCAHAGRGGTGGSACRTHGEGGYRDPTVETPDPTVGSQNPESSARRWSRVNGSKWWGTGRGALAWLE